MSDQPSEVRVSTWFAPSLLVSFLFGLCIIFSRGAYSEPAFLVMVMGALGMLGLFVAALIRNAPKSPEVPLSPLLQWGLWAALVGGAYWAWIDTELVIYAQQVWMSLHTAQSWGLALLFTYVPFMWTRLREPELVRVARISGFALCLVFGAIDVVKVSPQPRIDVWTVQQQGAELLREGRNPYRDVRVADTGSGASLPFVPYVYPPTQVYATYPFWALFGDVRYAMVASLVLLGATLRSIVRRANRGLPAFVEDAPALFIWLMPKLFFIVEQSWVDPVQNVLLAAAAAAIVSRRPMLTAVLWGVVLTAKQTMFWGVGLAGLLLKFTRKQWLVVAGVGGAMVLPFALWDFAALRLSLFELLSGLPNRPDALTFNNWSFRHFQYLIPGSAGFALAVVVAGLSWWKLRGSPAKFGLAQATIFLVFFTFNKWCFANYYFTLASLAALAAALSFHDFASDEKAPA